VQLADYLHQHLAPHGHDSPEIWSDLLAEQVAHVAEHWLTTDEDGQRYAWHVAHPGVYRQTA
jgi:hypothetical protein